VNHNDRSIEQTRDNAKTFSIEDGVATPLAHRYECTRLSIRFNVMHDSADVHRFLLIDNRTYVYTTFIVGDDLRIKNMK
jgi:hypothetical protein